MADDNQASPPSGRQQTPPNGDLDYGKLEERVRNIEETIARVTGVVNIIRWIVPPLLIVGGGALMYALGKWA